MITKNNKHIGRKEGHIVSEETKRKIRNSYYHTIKCKENIMPITKGQTLEEVYGKEKADNVKRQISKTMKEKGISGITKFQKGYKQTEESKIKIGDSKRGKKVSEEQRQRLIQLRKNLKIKKQNTSIELKIQNYLKQLKIGFFTHVYMKEIEHPYHCDIFIPVQKSNTFFIKQPIIIECDGNYWHKYPIGLEKDHIHNKELENKGFKVIRLWEKDIKNMGLIELENKIGGNYLGR